MLRAAILTLAVCWYGSARGQYETSKLAPVFSDDFSEDTRTDYALEGDVSWQKGKLTLADGASIERIIDGGPWTKVTLRTTPVELTAQQPQRELRVWFLMDGTTSCYVRVRHKFERGKTLASIALVDTGEEDGKRTEKTVRDVALGSAEPGEVRLEYRYGLVRVMAHDRELVCGHIWNADAPVRGIAVMGLRASSGLLSLTAATHKPGPTQYTDAEKQRMAQAETADDEAYELYEQGQFAKAAEAIERALTIRRSVLGDQHPDHSASLNNLATLYRAMGETTRAEPLLKQAVQIVKSERGERHPDYATCLSNLAYLYQSKADYPRAEPLYQQAIQILKSTVGEQDSLYATALNNLAELYKAMGDYSRAEPLSSQALEIIRTVLGEKHPSYATMLNNFGGLYRSIGDYDRAATLYRQCVEIKKAALGSRHPGNATGLMNLAGIHKAMGDYARAEPLYRQAAETLREALGEEHPDYAVSLNGLATLYENMGDYARAEPLLKQALEIRKSALGEQHPDFAESLNNLAGLYESLGDFARAEPLYKQSLEIRKSVLGEQHQIYAQSLNNLAGLYESIGDHADAEPLYRKSLEIDKSALGERHPSYAVGLNNLADLYASMGQYTRAEPLYQQCLDIEKSVLGEQHPTYGASLNNLAALYERMGNYARATPLYRQALEVRRSHINANATIQSARQQTRNERVNRDYLDNRLTNATELAGPDPESVAADLWQWKGAVTARQQAYRRVAANPKLAPLFADLQSVTQRLSVASGQIPIQPLGSESESRRKAFEQEREIWEKRVAKLTRRREQLEQQVAAGSLEFRHTRDPLTVEIVQSLLPERTAFIDFLQYQHGIPDPDSRGAWVIEPRYLAVVVRDDGSAQVVGLGSAEGISEDIARLRRTLTAEPDNAAVGGRAAERLRERVWLSVEEHLDGIETVVISPDTALGTLPFAALPGKSAGSYLLEEYKFVSLPLAGMLRSLLDETQTRPQPEKGLLVLGDVDYDAGSPGGAEARQDSRPAWMRQSAPRSGDSVWVSLPGFQEELAIVRDRFEKKFGGGVTTLRGRDATEAAFIRQASRHYNLHLVTHGYFAAAEFEALGSEGDAESRSGSSLRRELSSSQTINQYLPGLLSGLALAGANDPPRADDHTADGILTASEIETLDLNAVDLVVLSACETGLGKSAAGEGLTGLQRAFHIAGARSVVATLWKVDDKATQELMSRFYRNYWDKGQSKIDALRNAQLEILRNPRMVRGVVNKLKPARSDSKATERTPPYLWAAFTLSGDWR